MTITDSAVADHYVQSVQHALGPRIDNPKLTLRTLIVLFADESMYDHLDALDEARYHTQPIKRRASRPIPTRRADYTTRDCQRTAYLGKASDPCKRSMQMVEPGNPRVLVSRGSRPILGDIARESAKLTPVSHVTRTHNLLGWMLGLGLAATASCDGESSSSDELADSKRPGTAKADESICVPSPQQDADYACFEFLTDGRDFDFTSDSDQGWFSAPNGERQELVISAECGQAEYRTLDQIPMQCFVATKLDPLDNTACACGKILGLDRENVHTLATDNIFKERLECAQIQVTD